jgi:hypothetical protein
VHLGVKAWRITAAMARSRYVAWRLTGGGGWGEMNRCEHVCFVCVCESMYVCMNYGFKCHGMVCAHENMHTCLLGKVVVESMTRPKGFGAATF